MASQNTVSARAMANEAPFDQLAKNQLIVAVNALRSAPVARETSSPEMVVDPSKPFDPLVECGVLTAAQADQLKYRGVRTRDDLVQRVQSGTRRRALSVETGISEDSLLAAGVVAHAISSMPSDSREGIRSRRSNGI